MKQFLFKFSCWVRFSIKLLIFLCLMMCTYCLAKTLVTRLQLLVINWSLFSSTKIRLRWRIEQHLLLLLNSVQLTIITIYFLLIFNLCKSSLLDNCIMIRIMNIFNSQLHLFMTRIHTINLLKILCVTHCQITDYLIQTKRRFHTSIHCTTVSFLLFYS